jgi:hypothetical protein
MRRLPVALMPALLAASMASCGGGGDKAGTGTEPTSSAPAIGISSSSAIFTAAAGGASPAAQTFAISNGGTGSLNGLATGTIVYGTGQTAGWLTASLSSTSAPATLTLTPALGTLAAGTYTASVPVTASVAGVTNSPQTVSATLTVTSGLATSLTLAVGQSTSFLSSPNFSTKLAVPAGSQYLIEVVNTDTSASVTEGFSLTGTFGTSASALQVPSAVAPVAKALVSTPVSTAQPSYQLPGGLPVSMATLNGMAKNHIAILDANRQIYAKYGNPQAAWAQERATSGRNTGISASLVATTVGTVNKVYVRNSLAATCSAVDSIGARTVAIGQHVIVLADTSLSKWPNAYRPDSSYYQTFANEYDQITWPHLLANIGNPIAYDASLSGTGKVTVVITPVLDNLAGVPGGGTVVAFVSSCDFYPNRSNAIGGGFSNQTETFYSFVPAASNGYPVTTWEAELRATAAHESKHIVSFSDRIINGAPFEDIWLEEGLAQESSEIWERNFNSATWMGNANFLQTVACELSLGANAPCANSATPKPYALVASHLPFLFEYLQAESTSNSEGLGVDTPSNYGAGWLLARWATDQYASGNEGTFMKSLINEPSLTGLANLSLHTGATVQTLLTYFNLATATFQTPTYTASDVRTTVPSFNLANIDSIGQNGLRCNGTPCGLFTASGSTTPIFPIQPIAVSSAATINRAVTAVPGTSASYFLFSASSAGFENLQLLTAGGAALSASSGLRVAIIRVQ